MNSSFQKKGIASTSGSVADGAAVFVGIGAAGIAAGLLFAPDALIAVPRSVHCRLCSKHWHTTVWLW